MTSTHQQIKTLMIQHGWNPHRLAKASGVAESTVRDFLDGRNDTTTAKADAMLAVLLTKGKGHD